MLYTAYVYSIYARLLLVCTQHISIHTIVNMACTYIYTYTYLTYLLTYVVYT